MDLVKVLVERITQGSALAFFILMLMLIVGPRLAEAVRLPAMVGLVLAGMLVGPHGIHVLLTGKIALSALGTFGLLYLMFSAGLELDLKLFARMKKAAMTFAALSFVIPCAIGIASAKLLHYNWPGAVLMARIGALTPLSPIRCFDRWGSLGIGRSGPSSGRPP